MIIKLAAKRKALKPQGIDSEDDCRPTHRLVVTYRDSHNVFYDCHSPEYLLSLHHKGEIAMVHVVDLKYFFQAPIPPEQIERFAKEWLEHEYDFDWRFSWSKRRG